MGGIERQLAAAGVDRRAARPNGAVHGVQLHRATVDRRLGRNRGRARIEGELVAVVVINGSALGPGRTRDVEQKRGVDLDQRPRCELKRIKRRLAAILVDGRALAARSARHAHELQRAALERDPVRARRGPRIERDLPAGEVHRDALGTRGTGDPELVASMPVNGRPGEHVAGARVVGDLATGPVDRRALADRRARHIAEVTGSGVELYRAPRAWSAGVEGHLAAALVEHRALGPRRTSDPHLVAERVDPDRLVVAWSARIEGQFAASRGDRGALRGRRARHGIERLGTADRVQQGHQLRRAGRTRVERRLIAVVGGRALGSRRAGDRVRAVLARIEDSHRWIARIKGRLVTEIIHSRALAPGRTRHPVQLGARAVYARRPVPRECCLRHPRR